MNEILKINDKDKQDILINEITSRLVNEFHPEKILLFGSYAWGKSDENSDLDFMVIVQDSNLKSWERAVKAHLCMRGIPLSMDIIVKTTDEFNEYAKVFASLESQILEKGKILYERIQN